MDPLLEQFLNEARKDLALIDQNIEEIGSADKELLNSVLHAVHAIKVSGENVGFNSIRDIAQHIENLLEMLRDSKLKFVAEITDVLYNAFYEIMNLIELAEESSCIVNADEKTIHTIIESLNAQMANAPKINIYITQSLQNIKEQQYQALQYVQNADDLKRIISIMDKMRKYIPEMPAKFKRRDEIKPFLEAQLGIEVKKVKPKVKLKLAQKAESSKNSKKLKPVEKLKKTKTKEEKVQKIVVDKTIEIDRESIDKLIKVAGKLLVAKNSLPYLADNVVELPHKTIKKEIMDKYSFIDHLTQQLQDLIMGIKMVPLSFVFDKYPKLVRDISKKLGKNVKLKIKGTETKLDKNMTEVLSNSIDCILKNSLYHGIEMPKVREKKGKNISGKIMLRAYSESDKIIIEIKDDGAGINIKELVDKILKKGLMTKKQINTLSKDEKTELILLGGISNTNGMDMVKKSIEEFGGSIHVKTKKNQGTLITLYFPISLSVTSLLHIEMNGIHYGLAMDCVGETLQLERSKIKYLHNEAFIYIRGKVIPLLFIKSMLNEELIKDEILSIVVLNIRDNHLAIVVNKFLGQLDVVLKPLVGVMKGHPLFSATALLGNGEIIMTIDPIGLLGISHKLKNF